MSVTESDPSKAAQLLAFIEEHPVFAPRADHAPGWCDECDQQVSIDTGVRPFGPAESCEEHEPHCWFHPDGNH